MVRWLSASLMLLACLFLASSGVIEPELPAVLCSDPVLGWVGMAGYSAVHRAPHTSAQRVVSIFPAVAVAPHDLQLAAHYIRVAEWSARGAGTDPSRIYLRTARLRL